MISEMYTCMWTTVNTVFPVLSTDSGGRKNTNKHQCTMKYREEEDCHRLSDDVNKLVLKLLHEDMKWILM